MSTGYSNTQILIAFFICIIFGACSSTPLEEYVPENDEETKILSLLIQYQNARVSFDIERYLACLHDLGVYHHASRVMVSKKELSDLLPDFWIQLKKGDRSFFPMCRENLSGNYFVGFRLTNPQITVNGSTASVTITYVNTGWRLKHYISLIKDNDHWLINRLDWETG